MNLVSIDCRKDPLVLRIYQGRKRTHTCEEPLGREPAASIEDLRLNPRYRRAHLWPKINAEHVG